MSNHFEWRIEHILTNRLTIKIFALHSRKTHFIVTIIVIYAFILYSFIHPFITEPLCL